MGIHIDAIKKLLLQYGAERYMVHGNLQIWIKDDAIIVQLPLAGTIDIEVVEMIAIEQLGLSMWEYDYWLGQQDIR